MDVQKLVVAEISLINRMLTAYEKTNLGDKQVTEGGTK